MRIEPVMRILISKSPSMFFQPAKVWMQAGSLCYVLCCVLASVSVASEPPEITGEPRLWHRLSLTWKGPEASELDAPSPFLNYRLDVTFRHEESNEEVIVPGFFAADGNASESSAKGGNRWRVHFSPDKIGKWSFRAAMYRGENVAVQELASLKGDASVVSVEGIDGSVGSFEIETSDKLAPDWRFHGRLAYVGKRYLRCLGTDLPFLKAGTDSPETLLGYADFDDTYRDTSTKNEPHAPNNLIPLPSLDSGLHRYKQHVADWDVGDPTWKVGQGKGIIGGINYLSSRGVNSIYFLVMNVNGDGRNVWPWTEPWDRSRFDCSKLDQWEIVFSHMTKRGLMLHVVTQETENDTLLDGGELGTERKLYYRELIARFAHHPAVTWNLGEENVQSVEQRKACASYLKELDPYDHPIVIHNDHWHAKNVRETFDPLLGDASFTGTSLQDFYWNDIPTHVAHYVRASEKAGRPWVVCVDEMGGANFGTYPDARDPTHDLPRKFGLWGSLMAGGAGVEWYFGWDNNSPDSDLSAEDWRSRQAMFDQTKIATDFFQERASLDALDPHPELVQGQGVGCLADPGKTYVIYLPNGGATRFQLTDSPGCYRVQWFNPRDGGSLQNGSVKMIRGPGMAWTGEPPADATADWVVLIQRQSETDQGMSFPKEQWTRMSPLEMGVDPAGLNHALNYWKMHVGDDGIDQTVVVRRGVVVHQGSKADRIHNIYSCTKSFTSTALGLLVGDEIVSLDAKAATIEPLLEPLYGNVQLRHFATMTSGYSAVGISRWNAENADWSLTPYQPEQPFFQPGSAFAYWDEAQMMFGRVLTKAAKRDLLDLLQERVLNPIQMSSVKWTTEGEADGIPIRNGCTGLQMNAIDLARFGHLMLNRGNWQGQQLIAPEWIDAATRSQVGTDIPIGDTDRKAIMGSGVYGYNWWINGTLANGKRYMPDAPPRAFFAAGLKHNICLVIPEWEMVVVRMGEDHNPVDGHAYVLNHLMRKLSMAVYPLDTPTREKE